MPLDSIIIKDDFISIKFYSNKIESYLVGTRVLLFNQEDTEIGRYSFFVDEDLKSIDDMLVFY